jgi:lysophospholipase L1-like esterase
MKTILCLGDSNTWGYVPETAERYAYEDRWTSILQKGLGGSYFVIPEGFNGRTTAFSDPFVPHRNALEILPMIFESHKPVDLFLVMLGTNDTKLVFNKPVISIARGMQTLLESVQGKGYGPDKKDPAMLLIAPALIIPGNRGQAMFDIRDFNGGPEKSQQFAKEYGDIAKKLGIYFLDASAVAAPSPVDGIHWTKESHRAFGEYLAKEIPKLEF